MNVAQHSGDPGSLRLTRKVMFQVAGLQFGIVLLLILLNGLFALSELAVVSARTSRLQSRASEGSKGAKAALALAEQPSHFLSTVQIGITLIGIVNGALGGAALSAPVASLADRVPFLRNYSDQIGVFVVILIITYLSLIVGELVPKRVALQNPETIAILVAPAMTLLSTVTAPIVAFLSASGDTVIRLLGIKASTEPAVTEEEVELMLRQGAESGIFEEYEHRMVSGIFDIGDRTAGELMTPRHRIRFLNLADGEETMRDTMRESPHNFYPVCDGSTDNVVGIISSRELWRRSLANEPTDVHSAMTPALFVPEISPVVKVVDAMRHATTAIAVVVDEYGGVEGLITFNDILSDLVGEIDDPDRTNIKGAVRRDDGSWLVDGGFPAHELREILHIGVLPGEDEGRYETVGGFVLDQMGAIPEESNAFTFDGFRFEVIDMDGNRIDKVMVVPDDTGAEAGAPG